MKDFTVVLIRHGQSSANVSHMLSGCMDVPLTENGIRELESLRKEVDYPQDGIFFSSPLQRCIDTFHILFPGRTPVIRDSFHEIDFRSLEGWILSTPEEISAYFESWVHDEGYLDEETFSEVSERGSQAILDMVEECSAKGLSTATVVMHSGIMRASLVRLFSLEREEFLHMTVPNGLGVVIRFSDGKPVSWSWLERARMSGIYDDRSFFCDYAKMERSQGLEHSGEWYQLEPLFPALKGLSMLDLGCGYGWHCDYAARQGAARVLGIDESSLMLSEARRRFERPPVTFRQLPILDYEYPEGEWDLVFSNLALHYIEDLPAVFSKVHRTLTRGGVFLFNIEHPVFTAGGRQEFRSDEEGLYWPVRGYFSEGARTTSFLGHSVTKYHHSLSSIVDSLLDAGFSLERLVEARPSAEALRADERLSCELERPIMLIIRCRRT